MVKTGVKGIIILGWERETLQIFDMCLILMMAHFSPLIERKI